MSKVLNMTYASSLTKLCEINSSFDTGVLRICYPGDNPNGSFISKETIKKNLKTIYNCPIVCNYDRDSDTLGGHDMEVVRDDDGGLHIVNITQPIGVIPESSRVWFEDYEEKDGTVNEYLYADVLLWKRQEAYQKVKKDGITAHSMEITVKDGDLKDGVYHINDFEFTAFALIGVNPCFESSALEMFSKQDFKQQLSEMMQDLKESFSLVNTSIEVDDKHPQNYSTEGGGRVLNKKKELAAKYGIDVDSLDFSIEDFSIEELTERFESMKTGSNDDGKNSNAITADPKQDKFTLTGNLIDELCRVLSEVKMEREWGECTRYWYADCDFDALEIYCWDTIDWLLYGFTYTVDGDSVVIDYDSKKRKKYIIADFDEGEQSSPFAQVFMQLEEKVQANAEWKTKYKATSETITSMETELDELRQFKLDAESAIAKSECDKLFMQFEDLFGVEAFENLRKKHMNYSLEVLEEKCYAIRGKNGTTAKFSLESKKPKLKVEKTDISNDPYGGIFTKFGIGTQD